MTGMIVTLFGVGYLRPAPGTWGSLAALPLYWLLYQMGGFALTLVAIAMVAVLGVWAIGRETVKRGQHDPSEIVIDEVAGQWIALLPVGYGAYFTGSDVLALWPGWIAAFLFFRLFDIWKPWFVGRADRMETPTGVMLDDCVAGAFAAISTFALGALWHAVFL
jgi:phosphatidylglycerophosphatase A